MQTFAGPHFRSPWQRRVESHGWLSRTGGKHTPPWHEFTPPHSDGPVHVSPDRRFAVHTLVLVEQNVVTSQLRSKLCPPVGAHD